MTRADAWWAAGLAVAATVCGVLAYKVSATRTQARVEVAQLTTLQERVSKLESAASAAAETSPVIAETPAPPPPTKPTTTKPSFGAARRAYHEALVKMYRDPEARRIIRLAQKGYERREHPGLARSLGLSSEEEDRFLELLAEQTIAQRESFGRTDGRRGAEMADFEEERRVRDVEHMTLLGAEQYRRFQRYQATRPDRLRVQQFRAQLEAKDDLTEETAERLVEALATVREEHNRKLMDAPERHQGVIFGNRYGISMHIEPGEAGLEKAAAQLEETDRRFADATSAVLNSTQQRHFVEYLRQARESTLAQFDEIHTRRE
jgi:hypothetical protein